MINASSSNESLRNRRNESQEVPVDSFLETDAFRTLSKEEQEDYTAFKPIWKKNYKFLNEQAYQECVREEEKWEYRTLIRITPYLDKARKFDVADFENPADHKKREKEFIYNQIRIAQIQMKAEQRLTIKRKYEALENARTNKVLDTIIAGASTGKVKGVETGQMGLYKESGPDAKDVNSGASSRSDAVVDDFEKTQIFERNPKKIRPATFTLYPDGDEGALAIQSIQDINKKQKLPPTIQTKQTTSDRPTSREPKAKAAGILDPEDFVG